MYALTNFVDFLGDGVTIGALIGFALALPIALFLAFWFSAVKNRAAVVFGAFLSALIGLLVLLGIFGKLFYDTDMPNVDGLAVFFSSVMFCSVLALAGGIFSDLLVARSSQRDYRNASHQH